MKLPGFPLRKVCDGSPGAVSDWLQSAVETGARERVYSFHLSTQGGSKCVFLEPVTHNLDLVNKF